MVRVGVLFGGRSGEHDVSLCSAASVVSNLDRNKYDVTAIGIDREGRWHVQERPEIVDDKDFGRILKLTPRGSWHVNHFERGGKLVLTESATGERCEVDVVFPAVHGTFCEDGTLQGLLELAGVPYVGADVAGSAIGMDKDVAKRLLRDAGIPTTPWVTVFRNEWLAGSGDILKKAITELGLPLFVKPANAGSSVGVKKAKDEASARDAVEFAFRYDTKIIIETAVDCREIECAVLGNREPEASVLGEIIPRHEFYSYEAKYIDPDGASLKIPAAVDEPLAGKIRSSAVEAFKALCCSGMARVDFFLEKSGGRYFLNEINTLPGFTTISMYPKLWEASGLAYGPLLDRLIGLAVERSGERKALLTTR
jgi:D-alanine-D-alanine ligase